MFFSSFISIYSAADYKELHSITAHNYSKPRGLRCKFGVKYAKNEDKWHRKVKSVQYIEDNLIRQLETVQQCYLYYWLISLISYRKHSFSADYWGN